MRAPSLHQAVTASLYRGLPFGYMSSSRRKARGSGYVQEVDNFFVSENRGSCSRSALVKRVGATDWQLESGFAIRWKRFAWDLMRLVDAALGEYEAEQAA